ncbi:MAG: ABC transporter substrate-binding protein [Deinococcales bacterium]
MDAPKPYYDSYELLTINDLNARTTAMQTGKVHAITNVDPKTVEFLRKSPGITIKDTPSRGHYNFTARTDTNPFDSPDLVLAMKYALPRQQIIDLAPAVLVLWAMIIPSMLAMPFGIGAQRELDLIKLATTMSALGIVEPLSCGLLTFLGPMLLMVRCSLKRVRLKLV